MFFEADMQRVITNTRSDVLMANQIPVLIYKIKTPEFTTNCSQEAADRINMFYESLAKEKEKHCKETLYVQALETAKYIPDNNPPFQSYEYILDYKITWNNGCTVSLYMDEYSYMGGAHGSTTRTSQTWDFATGKRVELKDLLNSSVQYETKIKDWIISQIAKNQMSSNPIYFGDYEKNVNASFKPANFYLTPKGIVLYFQQYDIAPYAAGIIEFLLPNN